MFRLLVTVLCLLLFAIQPNPTEAAIGDNTLDGTEQCDDGNQTPGDGCDDAGQVEPGYICVDGASFCCPLTHSEDGRDFYHCALFTGQSAAALHCADVDGGLARVTSASVNTGVTPPAADAAWVDGTDAVLEDDWRYGDDTPVTFFNWGPGEPQGGASENCMHLLDDGLFYDVDCAITLSFICELEAQPEAQCGDGQIDDGEDCDDGNVSNQDACLNNCTSAVCGDGFVLRGVEECDDANTADNDACRSDCTRTDAAPAPRASQAEQSGGCTIQSNGIEPPTSFVGALAFAFGALLHRRRR